MTLKPICAIGGLTIVPPDDFAGLVLIGGNSWAKTGSGKSAAAPTPPETKHFTGSDL